MIFSYIDVAKMQIQLYPRDLAQFMIRITCILILSNTAYETSKYQAIQELFKKENFIRQDFVLIDYKDRLNIEEKN